MNSPVFIAFFSNAMDRRPLLFLLAVLLLSLVTCEAIQSKSGRCEAITVRLCQKMEYKMTSMPNMFNQLSQGEAAMEISHFWPLVQIHCSQDLLFFLCSMYVPICLEEYDKPIPVCRSVCERARAGCSPLMEKYKFPWPDRMDCNQFPIYGTPGKLCMENKMDNHSETPSTVEPPTLKASTVKTPLLTKDKHPQPGRDQPKKVGKVTDKVTGHKDKHADKIKDPVPKMDHLGDEAKKLLDKLNDGKTDVYVAFNKLTTTSDPCKCQCNPQLKLITDESHKWYNKVHTGGILNCAVNCKGPYFGPDEYNFTEWWLRVWSAICFVSTLITVVTFFLDMNRFQYPERPVIFLSGCYLMISIGYLIRVVAGHEAVACQGEIIRYKSTGPALCTIVFLLLYFFGMASSLWWVVLSLTWFLSAGLKWAQEAISKYSQYFHLIAWAVPSIKTVTVLLLSSVDGDPVAGICYVGNQDPLFLRYFVILPLCFYLLLGSSFLVAGFISLFRIRNVIKQQGSQKTEKLEKLMIRIGIFSLLYTLPATMVIACYFYEDRYKAEWEKTVTCQCNSNHNSKPDFIIFMLKYFMCLVVGITSSCWVWSTKTLGTWRNICSKVICSAPTKTDVVHVKADKMYSSISRPPPVAVGYPLSHV